MSKVATVALVGQISIVREGLCQILSRGPFAISRSVDTIEQMIAGTSRPSPSVDLIIIDGAANTTGNIVRLVGHFPEARIVLIFETFDFSGMIDAIRAGVHGILMAETSCECLIESLKLIAMGERVLPSQLVDHLPLHRSDTARASVQLQGPNLSPREVDIINCLLMGCPNKMIARRLDISEAAVKVHVKAVLRKIPVRNRTQAAIWAATRGLKVRRPEPHPVSGEPFAKTGTASFVPQLA